jgi:hypothetical protein
MADGGWGLEKEHVTAHVGGRRHDPRGLQADPITNREIGGKPDENGLFITNGRNLELRNALLGLVPDRKKCHVKCETEESKKQDMRRWVQSGFFSRQAWERCLALLKVCDGISSK